MMGEPADYRDRRADGYIYQKKTKNKKRVPTANNVALYLQMQ